MILETFDCVVTAIVNEQECAVEFTDSSGEKYDGFVATKELTDAGIEGYARFKCNVVTTESEEIDLVKIVFEPVPDAPVNEKEIEQEIQELFNGFELE